jgi:hypothetical protein
VYGQTGSNVGISPGPAGVIGASQNWTGVFGLSDTLDGVKGISNSPQHAGVAATNNASASGTSPSGYALWAVSNNTAVFAQGTPAGWFQGNVQVTGTLTVAVDIILNAPASDCAEEFDVGTTSEVEPGTVMVLDGTGALCPSEQGYDTKVAGVISGAGEYRPGLILDRQDSPRRRVPIAVVGKVFVKADASYGPIEVGALLTTSPTRGHAMKASDPGRAFGAVIGKALGPLLSGQGLVPVLVSLQ